MVEVREEGILDFEAYPKSEGYELKRGVAYLIDQILSLMLVLAIALVAKVDLKELVPWIVILLIAGTLAWLYKSLFEGMMGNTIGKKFMGLKVIDGYGQVTLGESLVRNFLNIVPVIFPVLDYVIGMAVSQDSRQKMMDNVSKTLVVEDIPLVVEEYRPRPRPVMVEQKPKDKVRLDYRRIRVGHCPRCGAPYRVLEPGDETFSGLWNHRCTWCNHKITENASN